MSHWNDARIAVEKRLNDNWTTTKIRFWSSGAPFTVVTGTPYIALQIEEFTATQVTLGSTPQLHRYLGQITIQVLVPERQGPKVADGYCDTLDDLFRRAQFSHGTSGLITCRTPQKETVGVLDGWYQVNLKVPYMRDKSH